MKRADEHYLSKIFKEAGNHRRLQMLNLLSKEESISVLNMAEMLDMDFRNVSQHITRLTHVGLVFKHYEGRTVQITLTDLGKKILTFARTLE